MAELWPLTRGAKMCVARNNDPNLPKERHFFGKRCTFANF